MSIEESLVNLKTLQADYQQFHNDVWQDPESYGIIAESLKLAINTMRKYQKIEEIVGNYGFDTSWICLKKIREVIENGENV